MPIPRRRLSALSLAPLLLTLVPVSVAVVPSLHPVKAVASGVASGVAVTIGCNAHGVSPATIAPGGTASFAATITSTRSLWGTLVSFEVDNSAGTKVAQTAHGPLAFAANVPQAVSATLAMPVNQPVGAYSVKVLVFGPNWTPFYAYHYACAPLTVGSTATATATAVPPTATATAVPPTATATAVPPTATATAVPTVSTGSDPSGQAMPVGDIPGWHQIFADDFTTNVPTGSFPGSVYGSTWAAYPDGWKDTTGNGEYYPSKVLSVQNGLLNMYIHTENGIHMVAAPEPKLPGVAAGAGQLYGRYTVRFRSDAIPGYKTAWLLWPDSGVWPGNGEIDFPEGNLNSTVSGFVHHMNGTWSGDQDAYPTTVTYTAWHTATIEWSPNNCTFILDGRTLGTSTSRVPSTAMHWVLQTETQLSGGAPRDGAAGNVQIDWVAVYALVH